MILSEGKMPDNETTCEVRTKKDGKDFVMKSDNPDTCNRLREEFGSSVKTRKKKTQDA